METHETADIQIPVGAEVSCTDGVCGKSTYVLINPVTEKVTHFVVRENTLPHMEYVAPLELVAASSNDIIMLKCTRDELQRMDPFIVTQYIDEPTHMVSYGSGYGSGYGMGTYYMWPYVIGDTMTRVGVEQEQIPPGEVAVRRGTSVVATDGAVGHVDEFVVHPDTGNITHLVMREGHLWGQKDVSIPISAVLRTGDDTVALNLNKQEIGALPSIHIHRPWHIDRA
ncbi:MAG: PRC-barrel domain-containing protein [Chloroflexi bacterium]|nr:PRC-barrel domain-containing protein [Chloroflexota bacterium]